MQCTCKALRKALEGRAPKGLALRTVFDPENLPRGTPWLRLERWDAGLALESLSVLTSLSELRVERNSMDVTSLRGISALSALHNLCLRSISALAPTDLPNAWHEAGMSRLHSLEIASIPAEVDPNASEMSAFLTTFWMIGSNTENIHSAALDLSFLSSATALERLRLEGRHVDATTLPALATLTDLSVLVTHDADVEALARLPNLERLRVTRLADHRLDRSAAAAYPRNLDLGILAALTKLRYLRVSASGLDNVRPLTALTALTALHLDGLTSLTTLDDFAGLTGLRELSLWACWSLVDASSLRGLTYLKIQDPRHLDNHSTLAHLTALENLTWNFFDDSGAPRALSGLTRLTRLSASFWEAPGLLPPLPRLRDLAINIIATRGSIDLSALTALTRLSTQFCNTDHVVLPPGLLCLHVSTGGLSSEGALDRFAFPETLQELRLYGWVHATLPRVTALTSLRVLHIVNCSAIGMLPDMSPLQNLRELQVLDNTMVNKISGVPNLPRLRLLVTDCVLAEGADALSRLPRLRTVRGHKVYAETVAAKLALRDEEDLIHHARAQPLPEGAVSENPWAADAVEDMDAMHASLVEGEALAEVDDAEESEDSGSWDVPGGW